MNWIPIDQEEPPFNMEYLGIDEFQPEIISICKDTEDQRFFANLLGIENVNFDHEITHWCPIPEFLGENK